MRVNTFVDENTKRQLLEQPRNNYYEQMRAIMTVYLNYCDSYINFSASP